MKDKKEYIKSLMDEIEGKVWCAYNSGNDDGIASMKEHIKEECASAYAQGVADGGKKKEEQLGKYAMIGKAFCDWVGDDAEKVKNRDDVYDILDDINEGGKIVAGDEVMYGKSRAIVTRVYSENNTCNIFLKEENNFGETTFTGINGLKKTGKHYDIENMLR